MSSAVTYEAGERIARIALDDGKVNAMSLGFFEALGAALDRAERERPGAVIITGRPGVFSAGLDLKLLPTLGAAELRTTLITFARTMLRVFLFPIPTVAAVGGHAIAGGALLMFACDLRVAADTAARLRLNEVAIGLALPSWAILIARSAIPPARTRRRKRRRVASSPPSCPPRSSSRRPRRPRPRSRPSTRRPMPPRRSVSGRWGSSGRPSCSSRR